MLLFVCIGLFQRNAFSQAKDYAVEVAALRSQECAMELANGLLARGFEAYWLKADQPEHGIYYRVRVGRFESLDIARTYAENLLDSGLLDTCAITLYEAPLGSIINTSSVAQGGLQASLAGMPLVNSCPIKLPESVSTNPEELPEDLIAAIGKSQWLLSTSKSVVYTLPTRKATSPTGDLVFLMRAIDKSRWRLKNDVGQLAAPSLAVDKNSWRLKNDVGQLAAASQQNRQAIDSTTASSLSSLTVAAKTVAAAVNASGTRSVPNSSQILAAATTPVANSDPRSRGNSIPEINKTDSVTAVRNIGYFAPPKLQGAIEMRDGQLMMRIRNLDTRRGFSGVARVTISDDSQNNDVSPLAITLQPNEERVVPVNEASMAYGDWMLMVYDEKQAVQLIRSAPFGERPTPAPTDQLAKQPAQPNEQGPWNLTETSEEGVSSNGLPNVTGVFDATRAGNTARSSSGMVPATGSSIPAGDNSVAPQSTSQPQVAPGQVTISPRQIAMTAENVTMELDIASPRPLGYIKVSLRSGNYQDERSALMSTPNGRVPFLIPTKDATADFSYEIKDESGNVLSSGGGDFRQLRQLN